MDWRFTIIGAVVIGIGIATSLISLNLAENVDVQEFVKYRMISQVGGIIAGLGILLLLVSFGMFRRRR